MAGDRTRMNGDTAETTPSCRSNQSYHNRSVPASLKRLPWPSTGDALIAQTSVGQSVAAAGAMMTASAPDLASPGAV